MLPNVGTVVGKILTQVFKGLVGMFNDWMTRRKLEVEERKSEAFEEYHKNLKEVTEAEERIAAAAVAEQELALQDAKDTKHQIMLEHLKKTNP